MSYDLQDWFIDAVDRGQCLHCKGFTLERYGLEVQCYSCGRWFSGYDIGRSFTELMHLSTTYQKQQRQREHVQTYESMSFEEQLAHTPESPEDYGNSPE